MNIRNKEAVKALFSSVDGIGPVNPGEPSEKGKNDLRHGPDYKNKQNPNRNKDFNKLLEDEMEKQKKGTVSQGLVKSAIRYVVEIKRPGEKKEVLEFKSLGKASQEFIDRSYSESTRTDIKLLRYKDGSVYPDLVDHTKGDQKVQSSCKTIKSSNSYEEAFTVYPWDADRVTPYSDEDLGLSYVVEVYGDEYVNVDENELELMKDGLARYFDDEAFVRDWNINNPDDEDQIESFYDIYSDPEELSVDELARYFDYDAFGRDLRLEYNMVWDKKRECWFAARDIDEFENEDDILFLSNR